MSSKAASATVRCSPAPGVVHRSEKSNPPKSNGTPLAAAPGARLRETPGNPRRLLSAGAGIRFRCRGIDVVGVKADLVVDFALLGIAENFVRLGERLELFFGRFVPRIDVGMVLARELAKRFTNIVSGGRLLHAENLVIIFLGCRCHSSPGAACLHAHKRGQDQPAPIS